MTETNPPLGEDSINAPADQSRKSSLLLGPGARLASWIVWLLGASFRWQLNDEWGGMGAIAERGEPHILLAWHNRLMLAAPYFVKTVVRRGRPINVLISLSNDGELAARIAQSLGAEIVRGSSSRGGAGALRKLLQAVRRESSSVVIIPDGPRGPLYELKTGALVLSQMTGIPVLPVGLAVSRCSRLRSWDRLIIPWFGAKVVAIAGRPEVVPRHLSPEELETQRIRVENELVALTRRAETELGVPDAARADS